MTRPQMKQIVRRLLLLLIMLGFSNSALAGTRHFAGAINTKLKIKMRLDLNDGQVSGAYYYEKHKVDIRLEGTLDGQGNLSLTEYDPSGQVTGRFVGRFVSDRRIEGKWIKPDGSKSFSFYVQEDGGSPGDGSGRGSGGGDPRFVGEWWYRITDIGGALQIKADGTFVDEWNGQTSRGTWSSSGNTIILHDSRGEDSSATYEAGNAGACLILDSGHPACK